MAPPLAACSAWFSPSLMGGSDVFEPRALSALLAAAGFIALVLVPELKYPANPPAIGAAETIGARTALYFAMLAISLLAMILAVTLAPYLSARLGPWTGALAAAAVFIVVVGIAAVALPPVDEVPAGFPACRRSSGSRRGRRGFARARVFRSTARG